MGMKEEITSIARSLGYTGPTPASKTSAVHAVAEVAGNAGGGGAAGYDVTKVYAVPEQTVTSENIGDAENPLYAVRVTVGNLAQMYADGMRDCVGLLDGTESGCTIYTYDGDDGPVYEISSVSPDGVAVYMDNGVYLMNFGQETEPTTHTMSAYYVDATTTADFNAAVREAGDKVELKVAFTLQMGEPGQTSGVAYCDRTFEELGQASMSGTPVSYWLDMGFGKALLGMPMLNMQTGSPDITFTRIDSANAIMQTWEVSATLGESGQQSGWQYSLTETEIGSGGADNFLYVSMTNTGTNTWTLDANCSDIYNAYADGKRVMFGDGFYQAPVFMENVVYISRPSASVLNFTFFRYEYNPNNNQLICRQYVVADPASGTSATSTMTLTETIYQLTPAS